MSSLVDTAIILNMIESHGKFHRILQVVKSRGSAHSHRVHGFKISSQGIEFTRDHNEFCLRVIYRLLLIIINSSCDAI